MSGKYDLSNDEVLVLVFNHVKFEDPQYDRAGAEVDQELITKVFQMYYRSECKVFLNFEKEEVKEAIKNLTSADLKGFCCVITIVMSHGLIDGSILAKDGECYNFYSDIVDKIGKLLEGKPKLFIGQFCRTDPNEEVDQVKIEPPTHQDCFIINSAYWGSPAYRYAGIGSPFIQYFFREMLSADRKTDIKTVHEKLNRMLENAAPMTNNLQLSLCMNELLNAQRPTSMVCSIRKWKRMNSNVES